MDNSVVSMLIPWFSELYCGYISIYFIFRIKTLKHLGAHLQFTLKVFRKKWRKGVVGEGERGRERQREGERDDGEGENDKANIGKN